MVSSGDGILWKGQIRPIMKAIYPVFQADVRPFLGNSPPMMA